MNRLATLRDLYRHLDWASDRVLAAAETLDERQLDRPFDMGAGSLRKTLWHVWSAHWLWFARLGGASPCTTLPDGAGTSVAELRRFAGEQGVSRARSLGESSDDALDREVSYRNTQGEPFVARVGTILLHVCNHAAHHHAQALNMLRHSGVGKPPRLDYLFMYHEDRDRPAPALSVDVLRDYFAYTDWARQRVLDAAHTLDAAALDRPFEMGLGSIRRNLLHVCDAESWWLANWIGGTGDVPFPASDDAVPLADLRARFDDNAARRSEALARTRDEDLLRDVQGTASPGRVFRFPLGVAMVQLNTHATHHRAQTINMLRQCGKTTPATDYTIWARESSNRKP